MSVYNTAAGGNLGTLTQNSFELAFKFLNHHLFCLRVDTTSTGRWQCDDTEDIFKEKYRRPPLGVTSLLHGDSPNLKISDHGMLAPFTQILHL